MADKEHLLDVVGERALLGLLVAVAVYFLLSGVIGPEWAWVIVRAGILFAIVYGVISAVWKGIENHVHSAELRRRELLAKDREIERMDRENERLRTITLESMGNFLNVDVRTGRAEAHFRPVSPHRLTIHQSGGDHPAGIEGPAVPALEAIGESLCVALVAPQGTGKTTFLQHLVAHRRTRPVILDPHGFPGKYGDRPIIGSGRDYPAIDAAMVRILDEVNRRYQDYHRADHPMVDVFVDEATLLNENCENFRRFIKVGLTEFRKANVRLTLCLHSRRSQFLGLRGAMDLADGVDFVSLKKQGAERWGELETDDGVIRLALPGPFHGDGPAAYQSGDTADADVMDAEWSEAGGARSDAPERDAKGGGPIRKIAGLIGYFRRPDFPSPEREKIWKAIYRAGEPIGPKDISQRTKMKPGNVRKLLNAMMSEGTVTKAGYGKYSVTGK